MDTFDQATRNRFAHSWNPELWSVPVDLTQRTALGEMRGQRVSETIRVSVREK